MRAIRAGICTLTTFAVLAFGGVTARAQGILEVGAASLLLVWACQALRQRRAEIHFNLLIVPLFALVALAFAQLFFGLSVYRYRTKTELLQWAAILVIYFLAAESFRTARDAKFFAWFLTGLGFFVSLFGIVQYFTFNGKLYWFVPLEAGGGPFGPFVNRDHFAGFVELTALPGLGLLFFRACRREQMALLGLLSILPVGALVLSGSRGGVLSFLAGLILLLYFWRRHKAGVTPFLGTALVVAAAGSFAVWLGSADLLQRFQELKPGELSRNQRFSMYKDTWKIFGQHPWAGTGLGTLEIVYPQYESHYNRPGIDHTHNDYLELLAEMGLVGGLCGLAIVATLFRQGLALLRSAECCTQQAVYAGRLAACSGLLVHSLVDFNFHIPSNALIFFILSALATTRRQEPEHRAFVKGGLHT